MAGMYIRGVSAQKAASDLQPLLEKKTFRALFVFMIKHPVIGARRVLPMISFSRNGAEEDEKDVETNTESVSGDDDDLDDDLNEDLPGILDNAEQVIIEQQAVSAAERASDRRLFGGRDRDDDRFVRLVLRSSFHDFLVPGGNANETQHVVFEPRLFLHETGVVQLTIQIITEGPLSADQVASLMLGSTPLIVRSEMSTPLLDGTSWAQLVTSFDEAMDRGKRVGVIEHAEPVGMTEVLLVHLEAVSRCSGNEFFDWFTYPTTILTVGDCCPKGRWRENHPEEVQRIIRKANDHGPLAPHVSEGRDFSYLASNSFFVNMGASTYIQWEGDAPDGINELNVILVIEYGLILHRRLLTMESAVARIALGERRLRQRYKDAVLLFSELRQDSARHGDVREIANHLLQQLGADQIRPNIETALNLSGMAHATLSESKASRRSWWLALAATVVAVLVSVPSIQDLLDSVRAQPSGDGVWLLGPLREAAALGNFWGAWAVVCTILVTLAMLWVLGWLYRHRLRRIRFGFRGFAWPTEIHVESLTRTQAEDG